MNIAKENTSHLKFWEKILSILEEIGLDETDEEQSRLEKIIMVRTSVLINVAAIIWGLIYLQFDEVLAGIIPLSYVFLSTLSLFILKLYNNFPVFRFTQIALILLLPFVLMMTLGGFIKGSVVILWALLAPIGALLSGQLRQALYWFIGFLGLIIVSGFLQPLLRTYNNLPDGIITLFFIINIIAVTFIIYLVLNYFVKNKDKVIELMRKNRELEIAQLEKEVLLRQSDKLATLGKLSAGIAHELNNPAAATLSGSKYLLETISYLQRNLVRLDQLNLSKEQLGIIDSFIEQMHDRSKKPVQLDQILISDREQEIESWLTEKNINDTWSVASIFAKSNLSIEELNNLANKFSSEQFPIILSLTSAISFSNIILDEIQQGTERITQIVKSLKSYSYQEEAPVKPLDVHEGLNDTLVMLRSQLKKGITVKQEYEEGLPLIEARGSELNQVWTNIIDNAITAMNGKGTIKIKTFKDDQWIVVQISDTGDGIPEDVQAKIFDPFFTTKQPGEGTGLGLNISHDIVVNRHKGKVDVLSRPGETCFEVRLPIPNGSSTS
jgi:signal transduction histidine kinase